MQGVTKFAWWVNTTGYQVVEYEGIRYLIAKTPESYKSYEPLNKSNLFRVLANTPATEEGILQFADEYGALLDMDRRLKRIGGTWAEPISVWLKTIEELRQAVKIADLIHGTERNYADLTNQVKWFYALFAVNKDGTYERVSEESPSDRIEITSQEKKNIGNRRSKVMRTRAAIIKDTKHSITFPKVIKNPLHEGSSLETLPFKLSETLPYNKVLVASFCVSIFDVDAKPENLDERLKDDDNLKVQLLTKPLQIYLNSILSDRLAMVQPRLVWEPTGNGSTAIQIKPKHLLGALWYLLSEKQLTAGVPKYRMCLGCLNIMNVAGERNPRRTCSSRCRQRFKRQGKKLS